MPPINVCINFGSKKGHVAAGEPEEGNPRTVIVGVAGRAEIQSP